MTADTPSAGQGESKAFVISREFDAPRDVVWQAFTDPTKMKQWWGPKGATITASKMDLRPGGTYHYGMRMPDGAEMWGRFVYREITPRERLHFVSSFSDADGGLTRHPMAPGWPMEMLTTFTFKDEGPRRTTFTVTSAALDASPDEKAMFDASHDSLRQGWGGTMDQLATYLAKA